VYLCQFSWDGRGGLLQAGIHIMDLYDIASTEIELKVDEAEFNDLCALARI
jgi:hypothetical protein